MRNMLRGLMVGAVVGAAIGLILDWMKQSEDGASGAAESVARVVREHGPELGAAVAAAASKGVERLKQADLPGKARDVAERASDSDAVDRARGVAHSLADSTRKAAEAVPDQAQDLTATVRD